MVTHNLPLPATGEVNPSPLRKQNPFLDAMLELPSAANRSRSPVKLAVSFVVHVVVLAALIIVPIYFANNTLNLKKLEATYVFTPPPPPAPPPPAPAPQKPVKVMPQIVKPILTAPTAVPKEVPVVKDEPPPPAAPSVGVVGGVEGGSADGVLGGILGGSGTGPAPPPPPAEKKVVRVGGNVKPPQLVKKIDPQYPPVARTAHVQGTVVIDAVIDKTGNVVSEHAVSGPAMLMQAALAAVKQWKYQPTYLNGEAVDLAMQVTVDFQLGG